MRCFELLQSPVQSGPLRVGIQEVIPASGAPGRIGAVVDVDSPFGGLVGDGVDLLDIRGRDAVVQNDIVVAQRRDLRHDLAQMPVKPGKSAEIVVALVGEIQADAELVDSGFAQLQVALFGHMRPVRNQNDEGKSGIRFDVADNFRQILAHQRFAAGDLNDAGAKHFHVFFVIGGLQIARSVLGTAVIAVLAIAGAGVCHLKGNDDRPLRQPVQRSLGYDSQRFPQGYSTHSPFLPCFCRDL